MNLLLAFRIALALLLMCAFSSCASVPAPSALPWSTARQMILVTSADWNATRGTLRRFERIQGEWRAVGAATPVMLGRSGIGWGIGQHPAQADGPQKREGDGRNPAGVFAIGIAFGSPPQVDTALDYRPMQATHWCMDVPASPLYNRIVDSRDVGDAAVQGSTERMRLDLVRADDDRYKLGFVIGHNTGNVPGAGSCIFAHLWGNPDKTTAGCTAMDEAAMRETLAWLKPDAQPVFVQLTEADFDRLQNAWALPARSIFR